MILPLPASDNFGVYIHIPFCSKRCDYCAFATWDDRGHLQTNYMAALRTSVQQAVASGIETVDTVFVGGGTPSLVDPQQLLAVIHELPLSSNPEITIECNPDNITAELMDAYAAGGVNRISMGVQSMIENVLKILGRQHNPQNVIKAVAYAKAAGIKEVNMDLIYGSVGESIGDFETTIRRIIDLQPTHVSAYGLTVESGTPLAQDPTRFPDDDDQADKYLLANQLLEQAGYFNYEISNWAKPGSECRHNLLYWRQGNYLGFGCAAHSHRNGRRWWNVRTPDRFIDLVSSGGLLETASETLTENERKLEKSQLALRTREGVSRDHFQQLDLESVKDFIIEQVDQIVLNPTGRLLANEISHLLIT